MVEYKTERVSHADEEGAINVNARFGWQLIDSQEVYNESTKITGVEAKSYGDGFFGGFMKGFTGKDGTVKVQQQTNVVSYVTLRFARDTQMPNYAEIKRLEESFNNNLKFYSSAPKPPKGITAITIVAMFIVIVSIILAAIQGTSAEVWEICVCIIVPIVFIPLLAVSWVRYKKKSREADEAYERAREAIAEATQLLG